MISSKYVNYLAGLLDTKKNDVAFILCKSFFSFFKALIAHLSNYPLSAEECTDTDPWIIPTVERDVLHCAALFTLLSHFHVCFKVRKRRMQL